LGDAREVMIVGAVLRAEFKAAEQPVPDTAFVRNCGCLKVF
jgi:hypothetical protein